MLQQNQFKQIRLRLGWSLSEMARRMGCKMKLVARWESLEELADPDVIRQYDSLLNLVDVQSEFVRQTPIAESYLKDGQLQQVSVEEVLEWETQVSSQKTPSFDSES